MKTIELDFYEITSPDGYGRHQEHVCYATTKTVADSIIKHLGPDWPRSAEKYSKVFTVVESVEEYVDNTTSAVRAKAASKLSAREREVLGIDEKGNHV